jgi:molybdate transport system regulatory protein
MSKLQLALQSRFWLTSGPHSLGGRGRIELLERIGESGSIRQAALAMGMSYKAAWDAVDAMNKRTGLTLIVRKTGGTRGGGAEVSEHGHKLIGLYKTLEQEHERLISELNSKMAALISG